MSVTFKMTTKTIFDQVPMAPEKLELVKEILASGWTCELGFNTVTIKSADGKWVHQVTLPVNALLILESPFKMTQAQKLVCGQTLVKLINIAHDQWANHMTDETIAVMNKLQSKDPTVELDDEGNPVSPEPKTSKFIKAPIEDTTLVPAKPKAPAPTEIVSLKEAAALLQKVKGSDAGSIYRVIALADNGLAIAARLDKVANTLSVRVEGKPDSQQEQALAECGITSKTTKGHMSAHYKLMTVAPSRVLGAILYDDRLQLAMRIESASDFLEAK